MNFAMTKRWIPAFIVLIAIITAYAQGWHESLTLNVIQAHRDQLIAQVNSNPVLSVTLYMGIYATATALSLPIAALLTILGGFLFGKVTGTLAVVTSATLGATIIFLIAKSTVGHTLRQKAGKLYNRIETNMKENAAGYMLFMRLVPLFPFFLVNIVPAFFNISTRAFVLTTFFGIMPGSFVYANVGTELSDIDNVQDILSPDLILAFTLLGFFALLPTLYKQWKRRRGEDPKTMPGTANDE